MYCISSPTYLLCHCCEKLRLVFYLQPCVRWKSAERVLVLIEIPFFRCSMLMMAMMMPPPFKGDSPHDHHSQQLVRVDGNE